MKKKLTLALAAATFMLTACGSAETASTTTTTSAATAEVKQPNDWATLQDMADSVHAATGNCPRILTIENGMGGCGDTSEGFYVMALNTADYPQVSEAHKISTVASGREEPEVVLWGEGWSINCWGGDPTAKCKQIHELIPSGTWVDLEPDKGFELNVNSDEPEGSFSDGTHLVGTDIQPGTYRTEGGEGCYWQRLAGLSGTSADRITNDFSREKKQSYVTIEATDKAFETKRCGTWEPVE